LIRRQPSPISSRTMRGFNMLFFPTLRAQFIRYSSILALHPPLLFNINVYFLLPPTLLLFPFYSSHSRLLVLYFISFYSFLPTFSNSDRLFALLSLPSRPQKPDVGPSSPMQPMCDNPVTTPARIT
jgi:hypothetical protein